MLRLLKCYALHRKGGEGEEGAGGNVTPITGVFRENAQEGGLFFSASLSWKHRIKTSPISSLFSKTKAFLKYRQKQKERGWAPEIFVIISQLVYNCTRVGSPSKL